MIYLLEWHRPKRSVYRALCIHHNLPVPVFTADTYMINIGKTWEKLMLAARIIVAIENPKVSSSSYLSRRPIQIAFPTHEELAILAHTLD